ncbi:MAG: hypothetical protein S4CHLAM20_12440 [Chlamydiia bacterium]|nr:hypothetical protein [Chlamydiia bacterium]
MKKIIMCLCILFNTIGFAEKAESQEINQVEELFTVTVKPEEASVIEELVTTMSETALFSLLFKKGYLRNLAKKLRPVSSTQFLAYVFERPYLIAHMKNILKSSTKWESLTRSTVRGLKREEKTTLYDDIPRFAKHTRSNPDTLASLARAGDFNGFIVHLLEQN